MEREIAGETSIFVSLDDVQRAPGRQERLLPERGRPRPLFFAERLLSERGRPRPLFFRNAYFRNAGVLARSFSRTPTSGTRASSPALFSERQLWPRPLTFGPRALA